jgi:pimeloyl-ACP methyl ester carboxylesterase
VNKKMRNSTRARTIVLATLLVIALVSITIPMFPTAAAQGWTLTVDARSLKAYPDLKEYVWQKNASMPPNGPYDQIALHRLVHLGVMPRGVVLLTNCPMWGTGEFEISNPATDSWTKYENFSQAIYWANRGFDVYAIDYRTHFPPKPVNTTEASYAANWGWDVWVGDIKEAADQVKAISGASKFFIVGQCTGAEAALNYATKYWQTDLNGIILLDMNFVGTVGYPVVGTATGTNTYNLTNAINNMNATNGWVYSAGLSAYRDLSNYALQNPAAPAEYPPGTPLTPTVNPLTNNTWANITEYYTWLAQNNFGILPPAFSGAFSNIYGGYGNVTQVEYCLANQEFLPDRLVLENLAMADWVNCPYMTYDYNDHYSEIGVPILAIEAGKFGNITGTFHFVNGTASNDFTGIMLNDYGHTDLFFGTHSAQDVSQTALDWMSAVVIPEFAKPSMTVALMTVMFAVLTAEAILYLKKKNTPS